MTTFTGEKTFDADIVLIENNVDVPPNNADIETLEEQSTFKWDFHIVSNVLSLCFIVFLTSWASGVPGSAIAFIAQKFPLEAQNSAWIATAPYICGAVVLSFVGDLSDIFGRKKFMLASCTCLCIGQLLASRANSLSTVIGGQVVTGVGSAIGFLSSPLLLEIVPKIQRPYAVAMSTFVSSFAFIGGPILEGLFIQNRIGGEHEGWRIGFYMGSVFSAICFTLIAAFYYPMPRPNPEGWTSMERLKKIDWVGIILATSGLTLFLVGINYGGNPLPWTSAKVLGPLVTGGICIFVFAAWVWKGTSTGVIPHVIFEDRNYTVTIFIRVVGGFALFGCQAFLPQMVVYVFGKGGLTTALWTLTFNVSAVLGSFLAAGALRKFKEAKYIVMALTSGLILGAGLLLLIKPGVSFAAWFFASFVTGLSIGVEGAALSLLAGYTVPSEFVATGVCVSVSVTYVGGALATTMYSQIFQAKSKVLVPAGIASSVLEAGLPQARLIEFLTAFLGGNIKALGAVTDVTPEILAAATTASQVAYAKVFNYIWYALLAWASFSLLLTFFYGSTKHYFTNEITAPVQRKGKGLQEKTQES